MIWARWRDAVPPGFRFSVKVPKSISHTARLAGAAGLVAAFLNEVSVLESKLGCLLVQLPPSLAFDARIAAAFLKDLRSRTRVSIACEPRHESWFASDADKLLSEFEVARVAADPARVPAASKSGGARHFSYIRLHGSPKIYYSAYSDEFLRALAERLHEEATGERTTWCIFDNTTLGAATRNALDLSTALARM